VLRLSEQVHQPDAVALGLGSAAVGRQEQRNPGAAALVGQPGQVICGEDVHVRLSSIGRLGREPIARRGDAGQPVADRRQSADRSYWHPGAPPRSTNGKSLFACRC
jgi:hypothetical protein